MGGQSYEAPYPVKRQDGSQIIWDWDKKTWIPYDPVAAKPAAPAESVPTEGGPPGREGMGVGVPMPSSGAAQPEGAAKTVQRAVARRVQRPSADEDILSQVGTSLLTRRVGGY